MYQIICSQDATTQQLIGFLRDRLDITANTVKPYTRGEPTVCVGKHYAPHFERVSGLTATHGAMAATPPALYLDDVRKLLQVPALVPQYERLLRCFCCAAHVPHIEYADVRTLAALPATLATFDTSEPIAFDIETNGVYWQQSDPRVLCLVLAQGTHAACIDGALLHNPVYGAPARACVQKWFDSCQCLVAHNASFDTVWLQQVLNITVSAHYDTMLLAFLAHNSVYRYSNGLKQLTEQYFNVPDYSAPIKKYTIGKNKGRGYENVPYDLLAEYAVKDVVYTAALFGVLRTRRHTPGNTTYTTLAHNRYETYTTLNQRGMSIDYDQVQMYKHWLTNISQAHLAAIHYEAGCELNPNSPKQLKEHLYERLGLPVQYGKNRKVTTNNAALQALIRANPDLPLLVLLGQYRKVNKVLGTYLAGIERLANQTRTKMHESFKLTATVSGRLGSEVLLLLPRAYSIWGQIVKSCLRAAPGHTFVNIDVSQLEVRVLAWLSQDATLLAAYRDGADIHSNTARAIYGDGFTKQHRTLAKAALFGYVYGASAWSMVHSNDMTYKDAKELIAGFEAAYPGVKRWVDQVHQTALNDGYVVNQMGRRLDLGLITDKNVGAIKRLTQNWLVQSFGSDIVQIAVHELVRQGAPIVLTVHDSVVLEVSTNELEYWQKKVVATMQRVGSEWLCDDTHHHAVPYVVDTDQPSERLAPVVTYDTIKDTLLYDELWAQMVAHDLGEDND